MKREYNISEMTLNYIREKYADSLVYKGGGGFENNHITIHDLKGCSLITFLWAGKGHSCNAMIIGEEASDIERIKLNLEEELQKEIAFIIKNY